MKDQRGQALMEFILFSVATFFALKAALLLGGKIWMEGFSRVYLQEFIFCQQSAMGFLQKQQCQSDFTIRFQKAIPFASVKELSYFKRSTTHHASITLVLLSNAEAKLSHSLVIE
jgi:hypothetical protein